MDEPVTLKLSEVRARTGISVETLKLLLEEGLITGQRGKRGGHVTLRPEDVPDWADVVRMLRQLRRRALDQAGQQLERVKVEIEAVENDLAFAVETPDADLGHDLLTVRSYADHAGTSLASAMRRLEEKTWDVRRYHDAWREALRLAPGQVD